MEEEGARSARSRISNYVTAAAAIAEGRAPRRAGTATMKNMVRGGGEASRSSILRGYRSRFRARRAFLRV